MSRALSVGGQHADMVQTSIIYHVIKLCRLVKGGLPVSRMQQPCRVCAMTWHCAGAMPVQEELTSGPDAASLRDCLTLLICAAQGA